MTNAVLGLQAVRISDASYLGRETVHINGSVRVQHRWLLSLIVMTNAVLGLQAVRISDASYLGRETAHINGSVRV